MQNRKKEIKKLSVRQALTDMPRKNRTEGKMAPRGAEKMKTIAK